MKITEETEEPFLSEHAKRNILGETARQVYNLDA
jgi:hypothetical protein